MKLKPLFFDPDKIEAPVFPTNLSATQKKAFDSCERQWALINLHKLKPPESPSFALGNALHKQLEDWFSKGITPSSTLARAALNQLPLRGSGPMLVEAWLQEPDLCVVDPLTSQKIKWSGKLDLLFQPPGVTDSVKLYDHKSTKSMSWALSAEDLLNDTQMMTYAYWVSRKDFDITKFELFHSYMVTTTATEVHLVGDDKPAVASRGHVEEKWSQIHARGVEMMHTANAAVASKDPLFWERTQPNFEACGAFGGCAFEELCTRKKQRDGTATLGLTKMFEGIENDATNNTNNPKGNKMALSDMLRTKTAQVAAQPPAPAPAPAPISVLPPDAPAQGPDAPPVAPVAPAPAPEEPAAKMKRGRPTKAEVEARAAIAAQAGATDIRAPAASAPQHEKPRASVSPTAEGIMLGHATGITLLIRALPMGGGVDKHVSLELVLANLEKKICEQRKLSNLYGLQYGEKASLLVEALKNYTLTDGAVYSLVSQDSLYEKIVLEALTNKATLVVYGSR